MHIANPGSETHALPRLQSLNDTLSGKFLLAAGASLVVAVCAHLSMPLPFTPVPLTFSDFAVLMVGLILGPETAFAALVLYLAEGAAGLPVFSPVGPGGIAQLLGRTGGYLFAYPLAATLAAALSRILVKRTSRYLAGFTAAFAASTLIMTSGTVWLAVFLHLSARMAFALGTAPFLPGQAVKILFAAAIFASLGRWRRA